MSIIFIHWKYNKIAYENWIFFQFYLNQYIYKNEVCFSDFYFPARVFPAEDERWVTFSDIVSNLTLPTITGCSADWITKFREDNYNSLNGFREYLFRLIDESITFDGDKPKYKTCIDSISKQLVDELETINKIIKNQKAISLSKNKDLAFDLIPIAVSFFTGLPPFATALTLMPTARHFVKNIVESFKAMTELKHSPVYIMTKLMQKNK